MAADSATTDRYHVFPETQKKIHRVGNWLIGASGSSRVQELACTRFDVDTPSIEAYRDRLMQQAKAAGWQSIEERGEPIMYNFSLLVATPDKLVGIAGCGSIMRPTWGFLAIGGGQDYAYGAAFTLNQYYGETEPDTIVRAAVEAACEFRGDCRKPIQVARL